jgi:hypothetical protein
MAFAALVGAPAQQKHSINHAGKKTIALHRGLPPTALSFLGDASPAFTPRARPKSWQRGSPPARDVAASR